MTTPRAHLLGAVVTAWLAVPCLGSEPSRSEAIVEAVVLYELAHFGDRGEELDRVCLEVVDSAGGSDPSPELLDRLQSRADVRARSACTVEREGVRFRESGDDAYLLSVGPIAWIAADEARVPGRFFRGESTSARPLYRVVLDRRRWVCLGPIIEGVPL